MDGKSERRRKVVGSKGVRVSETPMKRNGGGASAWSWPAGDMRRILTENDL
jgi:hypothetical protein